MKKNLAFGIALTMLVGMFMFSGCRSTNRTLTLFPHDRNVTVVKKPRRKGIKGRKKAVVSRKYNRAAKR